MLYAAEIPADLRVPSGNRLEKQAGGPRGQYSIRINSQWASARHWPRSGPGRPGLPRQGAHRASRARPGLDQALAAVREGDTLTVTELDRLAQSVPEALDILSQLSARGVRFALSGSVYDWTDPFTRMFLQILALIAGFEAT
jgi:Resolvase, N terminal domain